MNRKTKVRIWTELEYPPRFIGPVKLETAISFGMGGTHPARDGWVIEFGTGHFDKNKVEIFHGDIVTCPTWCKQNYVVRFGEKWLPFADSRDYIDDIGGEIVGFYLEPVPRGTRRKGDEHDRSLPFDDWTVLGNIHENPELLEEEQ